MQTGRAATLGSVGLVAVIHFGCPSFGTDGDVSDVVPSVSSSESALAVVLTLRPEDLLTCRLFDVFSALRQASAGAHGTPLADLVVAVVTNDSQDTTGVRRSLRRERLTGPLRVVPSGGATRWFDEQLPAVYLIEGPRVIRRWSPSVAGGNVVIARDAIAGALLEEYPQGGR
jgi:hypothetical protein